MPGLPAQRKLWRDQEYWLSSTARPSRKTSVWKVPICIFPRAEKKNLRRLTSSKRFWATKKGTANSLSPTGPQDNERGTKLEQGPKERTVEQIGRRRSRGAWVRGWIKTWHQVSSYWSWMGLRLREDLMRLIGIIARRDIGTVPGINVWE